MNLVYFCCCYYCYLGLLLSWNYLVLEESISQCFDGLNVQVISRFVKYQEVRIVGAQDGKSNPRFLTSRQTHNLEWKIQNKIQIHTVNVRKADIWKYWNIQSVDFWVSCFLSLCDWINLGWNFDLNCDKINFESTFSIQICGLNLHHHNEIDYFRSGFKEKVQINWNRSNLV